MEIGVLMKKDIKKMIDDSFDALKQYTNDVLVYGIGILEKKEDGQLVRIDPMSEEGQQAIRENEKKDG